MKHMYSARKHALRRYQFFFKKELNGRLGHTSYAIRKWIRDIVPIIIRAMRNMKKRKQKGTGIEKWLQWEKGQN